MEAYFDWNRILSREHSPRQSHPIVGPLPFPGHRGVMLPDDVDEAEFPRGCCLGRYILHLLLPRPSHLPHLPFIRHQHEQALRRDVDSPRIRTIVQSLPSRLTTFRVLAICNQHRVRTHNRVWAEERNCTSHHHSCDRSGLRPWHKFLVTMGSGCQHGVNNLLVLRGKDCYCCFNGDTCSYRKSTPSSDPWHLSSSCSWVRVLGRCSYVSDVQVSISAGPTQWVAYAILIILGLVYLAFLLMFVVKLIEAFVRIFGGVGFHRSRHVVDSGLYGACGLAGWFGSQPRKPPQRQGHHRPSTSGSGSGSGSGPPFRKASSQLSLSKQGPHSLPTPTSSAPPSVLRPEHALQPYREESDDEDGYIMGAWHSYTKPRYSVVENQRFADTPPPPQKPSGFMRVGGGRAHIDTPYAISSDSRASLDRQTPQHHAISSPDPDFNPPSNSFKFGTTSSTTSTPHMDFMQNDAAHNNPSGSNGYHRSGGSPPSPVIGRTGGRPNLPHGAMPPAHFRVQSQSAIVVNPGPTDTSNSLGSRIGVSNVSRNTPSPLRVPPTRYTSDDEIFDSPPTSPKKKAWFRGLRNRGQSDGSVPADEETGPSTDAGGGNTSERSFKVVRKNQGQGQSLSHGNRPSEAGSSGVDDSGQKKGSFVVLRGRDAN